MKPKKRTFFRNLLAIMIRSYRWRMNPKNIEAAIALEQQVWKLGFVCFITCFTLSCAPVKKIETIHTSSETTNQTEVQKKTDFVTDTKVTDKTEKVTDKSIDLIEKQWSDLEIRITAYDTNKPIDSLTHKPPLMSETVIIKTQKKDKVIKNVDKSSTENNLTGEIKTSLISKIDSLQKVDAQLVSATETRQTPLNNWWKWLLVGIFTPVLIFLIIRFKWYNILSFIWKKYN